MFGFAGTSVLICYHRLRILLEPSKFCCHVFCWNHFCTTFTTTVFGFATVSTFVCYILFDEVAETPYCVFCYSLELDLRLFLLQPELRLFLLQPAITKGTTGDRFCANGDGGATDKLYLLEPTQFFATTGGHFCCHKQTQRKVLFHELVARMPGPVTGAAGVLPKLPLPVKELQLRATVAACVDPVRKRRVTGQQGRRPAASYCRRGVGTATTPMRDWWLDLRWGGERRPAVCGESKMREKEDDLSRD